MSRVQDDAYYLASTFELNVETLMQYPEWAEVTEMSVPATQRAGQYLYQHYSDDYGGRFNLVVPAPRNGFVIGVQQRNDAETVIGLANQEQHLHTRLRTQVIRVDAAYRNATGAKRRAILAQMSTQLHEMQDREEAVYREMGDLLNGF